MSTKSSENMYGHNQIQTPTTRGHNIIAKINILDFEFDGVSRALNHPVHRELTPTGYECWSRNSSRPSSNFHFSTFSTSIAEITPNPT